MKAQPHRGEGERYVSVAPFVDDSLARLQGVEADGGGGLVLGHQLEARLDARLVEDAQRARIAVSA